MISIYQQILHLTRQSGFFVTRQEGKVDNCFLGAKDWKSETIVDQLQAKRGFELVCDEE